MPAKRWTKNTQTRGAAKIVVSTYYNRGQAKKITECTFRENKAAGWYLRSKRAGARLRSSKTSWGRRTTSEASEPRSTCCCCCWCGAGQLSSYRNLHWSLSLVLFSARLETAAFLLSLITSDWLLFYLFCVLSEQEEGDARVSDVWPFESGKFCLSLSPFFFYLFIYLFIFQSFGGGGLFGTAVPKCKRNFVNTTICLAKNLRNSSKQVFHQPLMGLIFLPGERWARLNCPSQG